MAPLKFACLLAAAVGVPTALGSTENICLGLVEKHCEGKASPQVMSSCLEDHILTCGTPAYCLEPAKTGMCRAAFPRFYYNPESGSCEDFIYGGCGGNHNNFQTQDDCSNGCSKGIRFCGGDTGASCPDAFECVENELNGDTGICVPATDGKKKKKAQLRPGTGPNKGKQMQKLAREKLPHEHEKLANEKSP